MRYFLLLLAVLLTASTASAQVSHRQLSRKIQRTERKLNKIARRQQQEGDKQQGTPDLFWIQEYLATMNPITGKPEPEALLSVLQNLNDRKAVTSRAMPGTSQTAWTERGPNNIGGRTRALCWDPNDPNGKKVWAGAVTGGLWYNNDITSSSSGWVQVSTLWSNLTISAIAWDPNNSAIGYVGTGEGYGTNSSTSRGFGVWKTTDSGKTWSQLSSTTSWFYVNDIVVRNESGSSVVYVAVDAMFYQGADHGLSTYGLQRSTNGGSTWTNVIGNAPNGNKFSIADLELAADNRLWAGTKGNRYGGSDNGGGRILYSDNGTTWSTSYSHTTKTGRVEIGVAPGKAYTLYAIIEVSQKVDGIIATFDKGANWLNRTQPDDADNGITSTDFSRNQAWYDLILAVDPNDSLKVYAGAINLFRSTNGCSSWTQISKWSQNANMNLLNCPLVHADQHAFVFKPGSSSVCIMGNDGGVYYSSNIANAVSSSSAIVERVKNYNTVQYYWGDFAAGSGSNNMIAGAQDNGTQKFTSAGVNSATTVTGGDGGYCFISPSNVNKQVSSYVYNQFYYTTDNWSNGFQLISDGSTGKFINPAEWDDNGPGLFTGKGTGTAYRITLTSSPGTLQTITWGSSGAVSALKAYKQGSGNTRLWVGTDLGKVLVTSDAWATTPSFSDKSTGINAGNVSDIYALRGGDTVAVTLSNYGSTFVSIYLSTNGGTSWSSREGTLPNIPVWSIVINPNNPSEAVIGTEAGIYGTTNFFASSPTWTAYTTGMGSVKIRNIRYRSSDKMLLAVTHGRGLFTSDAWAKNTPLVNFGASTRDVCTNQQVSFSDSSLNDPTSWAWTFSPRNFTYTSGTDSTSKNPVVRFTKGGSYQVKLTASNSLGSGTLTRNTWITVTDTIPGTGTASMSRSSFCAGDTFTLTAVVPGALSGTITSYSWRRNVTNTATTATYVLAPAKNDSFSVLMSSNAKCVSPATFRSNVVKPIVIDNVQASAKVTAPAGCSGKSLQVQVNGTNTGTSPSWNWFKNGSPIAGNTATQTVSSPVNGDKYHATVNVVGPCVKPANLIYSDTATLVIKPTPAQPVISRNFDTLRAVNQGPGQYQWLKDGNPVGTGLMHIAKANGNYTCVYTQDGCSSDPSSTIAFNSLLINDAEAATWLRPNPATHVVLVPFVCGERAEIYNMAGTLVKTTAVKYDQTTTTGEIAVTELPAGQYLVQISEGMKVCRFRFIKQ